MIEKIFEAIYLRDLKDKIFYIKERSLNSKPYMFVILKGNSPIFLKFYSKFKFSKGEVKSSYEVADFFVEVRGRNIRQDRNILSVVFKNLKQKGIFAFYLPYEIIKNISLGVVFSITPKCNLKCKYCFNIYDYDLKKRNLMSDLSLDELKELFDNFKKNNIQMIILSGGEPMLHPNIVEVVDYLYKKGFYIILNTNGTILNKNLIDRLLKYPIHWMISIHERDEDSIMRRVGLKNLLDLKLRFIEYLKSNNVFYLEILTILTPENIRNLERLYNFVYSKIKPDNWQFFRLFDVPGEKGSTKEDMIKAIDKIYELNMKYNVNNKIVDGVPYCVHPDIDKASKIIEGERHPSHMTKLTISPEGDVKYMCLFDEVLDNILISKDIKRSLKKPLFKDLVNLKYVPDKCNRCKYKNLCGGGSRFVAKLYTGKINGEDPLMDFK